MTRMKKSRKVNTNGPNRPPREKKQEKIASKKAGKGQKAGNRHSGTAVKQADKANAAHDPRLGSKKAVPLVLDKASAPQPRNPVSPEKELSKLENDARLHTLLERVEDGEVLAQHDQFYLETTLARIAVLMDELGIQESAHDAPDPSADKREQLDDEDLFAQFEQGEDLLKQFKE
ncbi:Der GTPase-activating protein YihI [Ferrimonas gelatinilytica]|uniref:Der GTPase-activating protein YihI n=1 Tax=Ferrimonas gelatinilytica TaxID=1255257 RepID=A0ABP9RUI5_9GAMM